MTAALCGCDRASAVNLSDRFPVVSVITLS
jgi:hypothetical protein